MKKPHLVIRLFALGLFAAAILFGAFAAAGYAAMDQSATALQSAAVGFIAASSVGFLVNPPSACTHALNPAAALKLDTIMRNGLRALKRRLSPILALSTVFKDQTLTETDTIQVPFYPLETLTSKDFDGSYDFANADGAVNSMPVTVDKRKYQALEFTSKDLRRNSVVDLNRIMGMKVEKLAEDILDNVFSVVTTADYGATIIPAVAAAAFDRYSVADIRNELNGLHWPKSGRALVLESDYEGNLVKDQLEVHTVGSDAAIRDGSVGRLLNFDIFDHPGMPENGEKLIGCALLPYAILVAFAPIEPAEEVREAMSDYRKYTDTDTGLTLEYRSWGDPNSDSAKRVVEASYGFKKGDTAQLKRIEKP